MQHVSRQFLCSSRPTHPWQWFDAGPQVVVVAVVVLCIVYSAMHCFHCFDCDVVLVQLSQSGLLPVPICQPLPQHVQLQDPDARHNGRQVEEDAGAEPGEEAHSHDDVEMLTALITGQGCAVL